MRKFVVPALAGAAALAALAVAPATAEAGVILGVQAGPPAAFTQVQWDGGYGGGYREYRPRPPGYDRPYGYYRPGPPVYRPRQCWTEQRWVETQWGPRSRMVRVCR